MFLAWPPFVLLLSVRSSIASIAQAQGALGISIITSGFTPTACIYSRAHCCPGIIVPSSYFHSSIDWDTRWRAHIPILPCCDETGGRQKYPYCTPGNPLRTPGPRDFYPVYPMPKVSPPTVHCFTDL